MQLLVERKSLGKTRGVEKVPYELDANKDELNTLRKLITALVRKEVAEFEAGFISTVATDNTKNHVPDKSPQLTQKKYTDAQLQELLESGRVSFGYTYHQGKVDVEQSISVVLQAVADGLVRVFVNNNEVSEQAECLEAPLFLEDGDTLTLLRLTFLTGQY